MEIKKIKSCYSNIFNVQYKKDDLDWQLDLLIVYLDIKNKKAKIKIIEDIVL